MKAIWNGSVIAESEATEIVEGNHYFPPGSVNPSFLTESTKTSTCPWKGLANYYNIVVDGKTNSGAAWYYANPHSQASQIKGHVAFWKGVEIQS
ncbi:hypothetical protein FF011L_51220 [Roseimaritima multifibrata]|uniref:DUF427 domain-containing protein n=1 Tax=Roseimaritima multifibrata TaxID=1930274 RepID=A0A517MN75_9BACT|nr:DUF427 domain-containing protein [Roseimaritima multifibrata]QDS96314.1 hypothetical protein FF011L_51220 [Roseimaritima multifibrata]